MCAITIRTVTAGDFPALAALYSHTVRKLGPDRYTSDQIHAWAVYPEEDESFRTFVYGCHTFVAVADGRPVGFSGIADDGHVVSLYVHGDFTRMGVGSLLLETVQAYAREKGMSRLYTEASQFSYELFGRFGFAIDQEERVIRNGVAFDRYKMSRLMD